MTIWYNTSLKEKSKYLRRVLERSNKKKKATQNTVKLLKKKMEIFSEFSDHQSKEWKKKSLARFIYICMSKHSRYLWKEGNWIICLHRVYMVFSNRISNWEPVLNIKAQYSHAIWRYNCQPVLSLPCG